MHYDHRIPDDALSPVVSSPVPAWVDAWQAGVEAWVAGRALLQAGTVQTMVSKTVPVRVSAQRAGVGAERMLLQAYFTVDTEPVPAREDAWQAGVV